MRFSLLCECIKMTCSTICFWEFVPFVNLFGLASYIKGETEIWIWLQHVQKYAFSFPIEQRGQLNGLFMKTINEDLVGKPSLISR